MKTENEWTPENMKKMLDQVKLPKDFGDYLPFFSIFSNRPTKLETELLFKQYTVQLGIFNVLCEINSKLKS